MKFCEGHASRGFAGVKAERLVGGTLLCKACIKGLPVREIEMLEPREGETRGQFSSHRVLTNHSHTLWLSMLLRTCKRIHSKSC